MSIKGDLCAPWLSDLRDTLWITDVMQNAPKIYTAENAKRNEAADKAKTGYVRFACEELQASENVPVFSERKSVSCSV